MIAMTIAATQWIRFFGSNTRTLLSSECRSPTAFTIRRMTPLPWSTSPQPRED